MFHQVWLNQVMHCDRFLILFIKHVTDVESHVECAESDSSMVTKKKKPTRHFKHIDFTFLCITNRAQSLSTLFQPRWSKCWLLSDAGSELVQPVNILGTELFVNPRGWKPLHMIPISQHCQDQLWRTTSTLHKCFQTTFSSGNTYNALFTLTKLALFFKKKMMVISCFSWSLVTIILTSAHDISNHLV